MHHLLQQTRNEASNDWRPAIGKTKQVHGRKKLLYMNVESGDGQALAVLVISESVLLDAEECTGPWGIVASG